MPPEQPPARSASAATAETIDIEEYQGPDPPNPDAVAADRWRTRKRMFIVAASSIVLLATIIIAGSSGLFLRGPFSDRQGAQASLMTSKIEAFCSLTDFPDVCVSSLTNYTGNEKRDQDPKSLLLFSVAANIEMLGATYRIVRSMVKDEVDERTRTAAADCQQLLIFAMAELNESYTGLNTSAVDDVPFKMSNMLSGLSAAVTFQQTCGEGLGSRGGTVEMREALKNSTMETRNNLALFSGFPQWEGRRRRKLMAAVVEGERVVWRAAKGRADVVVAKDGTGNFSTIGEALEVAKKERQGRFVIYVKEGVYEERVRVSSEMKYVSMYGDGGNRTLVTGGKAVMDGTTLYDTATFAVSGLAFMAKNMGFENTAGPQQAQAVALRVESDLSVFHKCHINGYQNTLHAHAHRQFYRSCTISGSIDIISGGAAAAFQNCEIIVKKPQPGLDNIITAHTRLDRHQTTGISMQNCTISASEDLIPAKDGVATFLGRPVEEHSRTVVMQSTIGDLLRPEGWALPSGDVGLQQTVYFAEFENRGPGADVEGRVKWPGFHLLRDVAQATRFTAAEFVEGIYWLNITGVQFYTGMIDAL